MYTKTKMKNIHFIIFIVSVCFGSLTINAQKINQFNEDHKRTGVWKKYHSNNRIRYIGTFVNGKEVGSFKYYDITSSKHPTIIKDFLINSDSAKVRYYNLDGKLRSIGYMIGRNRVGKWIYYFPNGNLFSEETYVNGKLEGELKNYYKNGKVLEITEYEKGKKNGFSKKFSDKGILIEEVHYLNDKLHGKGKYFELNGDLKEEGIYKNGLRDGKWEFYIGGEISTEKEKKKANKFDKNDYKN